MDPVSIEHVSDTSLWVAWYRAQETERPDAAFRDPFAARLAGERGRALAEAMPSAKQLAFAMVIRTVAVDRLIERTVALGVDLVLNLGAGLDARPYRMNLPAGLRWVEVDHESVIRYKNDQLQSDTPSCTLERIACDLSRDDDRLSLLSRMGRESRKAVVVTEGLLPYLTQEQAGNLSRDLVAVPSLRYWIQDYRQGKLRPPGEKRVLKKLARAPIRFDVDDPLHFFGQHGWTLREDLHILDVADGIRRRLPFIFPWSLLGWVLPRRIREAGNRTYGYALLEHAVQDQAPVSPAGRSLPE